MKEIAKYQPKPDAAIQAMSAQVFRENLPRFILKRVKTAYGTLYGSSGTRFLVPGGRASKYN